MAKILNIVETAYRGTIEEQDDTILWLSHMFKNAGADISVLLRSNAVNYAVKGQDASGLTFGDHSQSRPPEIDRDVATMVKQRVPVYVIQEDAAERGISDHELVDGVQKISRSDLPRLLNEYDHVWHW